MSWYAVGVAVLQTGYGIYQQQKGASDARKAEANRPQYRIPDSIKRAMMSSELRSLEGLPGEVKSEMRQQMDRSRMSSLAQINERRGGLGAIAQLEQQQQDAIRQTSIMDVQQRNQNLQNLQGMRMKMAEQEQAAWQWDEAGQYQAAAGTASAMQGAGLQNIAGGVTSIASIAASGALSKKKEPSTTVDGSDSIAARDETAGQYTIKPEDMQFVDGKWVPKEGAQSPYGETWDAQTGGWRDDAHISSFVNEPGGATYMVPSALTNQQLETMIPGTPTVTTDANLTSSTPSSITAATEHGVNVDDMEEINGTWIPKDGTVRETDKGTEIYNSDTGLWDLQEVAPPVIETEEVITEGGEVGIIDLNNNGVPDEFEVTLGSGDGATVIDSRTGEEIISSDETAEINIGNDQITNALNNSENINLSTEESSLKGQVSEANQIASAKNYGVDRSNLELVDGNWVPKEGARSIYGDTWDSETGGWRDDALTESAVYSDKKLSKLSNEINQGESELNRLIEEGKGLEAGTKEFKENRRKRDKLTDKLRNLEEKLIKREEKTEGGEDKRNLLQRLFGKKDKSLSGQEEIIEGDEKIDKEISATKETIVTKEMIDNNYSGKGIYTTPNGHLEEGSFENGKLVEGVKTLQGEEFADYFKYTAEGKFNEEGGMIEGTYTNSETGNVYEGIFDGVSKVTRTSSDGTVTTGTLDGTRMGTFEEGNGVFNKESFVEKEFKEAPVKETTETTIPTSSSQSTLKTEIGKVDQMQEDFINDGTIPKYKEFKKAWEEQNPNEKVPSKKEFKEMFTKEGMSALKFTKEDKEKEEEYQKHVQSNISYDDDNTTEYIKEVMGSSWLTMNEDNESITIYNNKTDFENKENGEIVTIKELLETQGKERADRILGKQQKKYRWGSGDKRRRNYVHEFGTREKVFHEDGSTTETITITAKNHPLYGKTYIRKSVDNPERGSKKIVDEAKSLLIKHTSISEPYVGGGHGKDFDMILLESQIKNGGYKNPDGSEMSDEDKNSLIKKMEKLFGRWDSPDIQTVTEQK